MKRYCEKLVYGYQFCCFPEGVCDSAVFSADYDDSAWQTVRVPHDWAADGEFLVTNDSSYNAVEADGVKTAVGHTGRSGGLPIVGLGVYRRWIDITEQDKGTTITLEFDGVMWEANIYINGRQVFFNHYGYKSFCVDITDFVEYGKPNLLAVSAEVKKDCSRWYCGAGIYRNAYLVKKDPVHIRYNGIWLRQLEVTGESASFELSVEHTGSEGVKLYAQILSPTGEQAAEVSAGTAGGVCNEIFTIPYVKLWDVDAPNLYTAVVSLLGKNDSVLDSEAVRFGARSFVFTADRGFFLNGRNLKIKGVCLHHDLGSLGAAVNTSAMRRQLRMMREMGANAIRTSHNPPAPELLDLCDEMGFLVNEEFFDEWELPKVQNGYAQYFRQHAAQDTEDILRRDRNHPCVIMWSIGNEIREQFEPDGWRPAKLLSEVCHRVDPTRPTTAGFNGSRAAFANHLAEYVDVAGHNYKPYFYGEFHEAHPAMVHMGAETASCVSSRGVYKLPAQIAIPCNKHKDLTVSAYELEAPLWANFPEMEFASQEDQPFVVGEFVWTGFDYLGEPTPYYSEWPSRSSYFGIVDLAGIPKNRFYGYKAHWTNDPTLHVFPHWNWEGMEGQTIPVHIYTNYPAVELFINGKSYGAQTHLRHEHIGVKPMWERVVYEPGDIKANAFDAQGDNVAMDTVRRYRLIWDQTVYEPGEVKAVAYDAQGKAVAKKCIYTAGEPAGIRLCADRKFICADGEDLVYITAAVVDAKGNICPLADNRLYFSVTGAGELLTTDNGDQRETESFARHDKKAFAGMVVACVRSMLGQPGKLKLAAKAEGLISAEMEMEVR